LSTTFPCCCLILLFLILAIVSSMNLYRDLARRKMGLSGFLLEMIKQSLSITYDIVLVSRFSVAD
jgi:hypothetical protein